MNPFSFISPLVLLTCLCLSLVVCEIANISLFVSLNANVSSFSFFSFYEHPRMTLTEEAAG